MCDPNTREWNYNAFIIVILLYELSFTSAVESSCAKELAGCLLCKEPSHILSPGVVVSLQWAVIQNIPHHMTLIKTKEGKGRTHTHKQRHFSPAEVKTQF